MSQEPVHYEAAPAENSLSRSRVWLSKMTAKANFAETAFLSILRYAGLVVAAVALVSATVLLSIGAVRQLGRTHVDPEPVTLGPEDVIPPKPSADKKTAAAPPKKAGISLPVRKLTSSIYQTRFKRYQREDTKITDQEVVDYVWSEERIETFSTIANQQLKDRKGKSLVDREAAMRDALALIQEASTGEGFKAQLLAYRNAKKVNVCTEEPRIRSRTVRAWDDYGTYCAGWYNPPVGCPTTRVIEEPYVEKVCTLKFPEDLRSPAQLFAEGVQRYADAADAKLVSARNTAEFRTAGNQERKLSGIANISNAGMLFLIFLGVMFLYLFVALERHHRSLKRLIERQ